MGQSSTCCWLLMWEINTLHALRFRRRVGVLAVEGLSTWEDPSMLLNINICRPQADAVTSQHAAGCALAVASKMSSLEANKYIYLGKSQDTVLYTSCHNIKQENGELINSLILCPLLAVISRHTLP